MNRRIKNTLTAGLLIGAIAVGNTAQADGAGVAGLWEVHITPDGAPGPMAVNLVHFDKDGTLTNIDGFYGTGLGTWKRDGGGAYTSTITHYFNAQGAPGMVVVEGSGAFGDDRDTATGEFVTTIYVGGAQVQQFSGTIESYRQ